MLRPEPGQRPCIITSLPLSAWRSNPYRMMPTVGLVLGPAAGFRRTDLILHGTTVSACASDLDGSAFGAVVEVHSTYLTTTMTITLPFLHVSPYSLGSRLTTSNGLKTRADRR